MYKDGQESFWTLGQAVVYCKRYCLQQYKKAPVAYSKHMIQGYRVNRNYLSPSAQKREESVKEAQIVSFAWWALFQLRNIWWRACSSKRTGSPSIELSLTAKKEQLVNFAYWIDVNGGQCCYSRLCETPWNWLVKFHLECSWCDLLFTIIKFQLCSRLTPRESEGIWQFEE